MRRWSFLDANGATANSLHRPQSGFLFFPCENQSSEMGKRGRVTSVHVFVRVDC